MNYYCQGYNNKDCPLGSNSWSEEGSAQCDHCYNLEQGIPCDCGECEEVNEMNTRPIVD